MKLGRVEVVLDYIVDLDNPDMVQHAKDAIFSDIGNIYPNDLDTIIHVNEDGHGLEESDIPEFLREDEDDD